MKTNKIWFARHPVWIGVIGVFILLFIIGLFIPDENSKEKIYVCPDGSQVSNPNLCSSASAQSQDNVENNVQNTASQPAQTTTPTQTTTPAVEEKSDETTIGEKNALKKALSYLDYMAFSYSGLIKQLEYEGYSHEEAVYGVDNCGADWNKQAALKAKSYLDYMAFSREGLIEQLEYEGFTKEQAEYGVQAVGY